MVVVWWSPRWFVLASLAIATGWHLLRSDGAYRPGTTCPISGALLTTRQLAQKHGIHDAGSSLAGVVDPNTRIHTRDDPETLDNM